MRTSRLEGLASRRRLSLASLGAVAGFGVAAATGPWAYAPLIGWDVGAATFSLTVWLTIAAMTPSRSAAHATREDPGRAASDAIVVSAAVASLAAVAVVLGVSGSKGHAPNVGAAAFGLASLALSWFTVHTLFALRYARLYYTDGAGGVNFNQEQEPGYLDFAYLSFTIGMTFQVSDTDLQTGAIRATALRHALLSYLFGAVILAATINAVVAIASSGG
ncbi:MAG: DUF1345 domain-containing protein [Actinomycetota bacterium]|nr:DUF1345 domain-containing protein [Actinomycetota bacterium]